MTVYIVGVSGKAGVGKDTLVDYMQDKLANKGIESDRFAFAKGVKLFGKRYFGGICNPVVKDPISRAVLQGIGHMMRSEVSENYWVDRARDLITQKADSAEGDFVVFITDVRYKNEADALINTNPPFYLGGKPSKTYLLRINGRTSLTGESALHSSEIDLDDYTNFTYVYNNVGTLQDLYGFGDAFIERILNEIRH